MVPRIPEVKFNYDDYLDFPNDGKRHEIIDGEHYVTPSPSTRHQGIALRLATLLQNFLDKNKAGRLFIAPCDVVLSEVDVVQPDLVFVPAGRLSIVTPENIRGVPELVIEIVSETSRKTDEIIKRKLYERHGVSEYWVIDPVVETAKVYRLQEKGYLRAAELSRESGDTLFTPLLPELKISLAELFRD